MSKLKVIIAGGRDFGNRQLENHDPDVKWNAKCYNQVLSVVQDYLEHHEIKEIVCGQAAGADTMGEMVAKELDIPVNYFPAEWHKHGRGAGFVRNQQMADHSDVLLAFWDGSSKGTNGMIHDALHAGLEVHVYPYKERTE